MNSYRPLYIIIMTNGLSDFENYLLTSAQCMIIIHTNIPYIRDNIRPDAHWSLVLHNELAAAICINLNTVTLRTILKYIFIKVILF